MSHVFTCEHEPGDGTLIRYYIEAEAIETDESFDHAFGVEKRTGVECGFLNVEGAEVLDEEDKVIKELENITKADLPSGVLQDLEEQVTERYASQGGPF